MKDFLNDMMLPTMVLLFWPIFNLHVAHQWEAGMSDPAGVTAAILTCFIAVWSARVRSPTKVGMVVALWAWLMLLNYLGGAINQTTLRGLLFSGVA